jgi:hypothetical protein
MSSDERWAKATAAVKQIEEVESARRDPVGAQADLAALRRAAVRITGCDVDADLSVLLAALGMVPSLEERVGIVQVLRDVAGGPLSPEDTAAVLAVLSRSVPSSEGAGDAIGRARLAIETWNDAITSEGLPSEVIEVTPRALKAMGAVLRACRGAAGDEPLPHALLARRARPRRAVVRPRLGANDAHVFVLHFRSFQNGKPPHPGIKLPGAIRRRSFARAFAREIL